MENRKSHWEQVYSSKSDTEVSWFQETPGPSLDLLKVVGAQHHEAIIDVGGGASKLVDNLVAAGFDDVTVLDISAAALASSQRRLGAGASSVDWIVADITQWKPDREYDIWHDRAVFHFLTDLSEQQAYVDCLIGGLAIGGRAIIGTFAPDGPEKCSGLPVARHDIRSLSALLGGRFEVLDSRRHAHETPWGSVQNFQYGTFRRVGGS